MKTAAAAAAPLLKCEWGLILTWNLGPPKSYAFHLLYAHAFP